MVVVMSAEPFSIRDFKTNIPFDKADTTISDETWISVSEWFESYFVFLPMTTQELEPYWHEIVDLDARAIDLMRAIAREWFPLNVERFCYVSMCRDFVYVIDRINEKRFDDLKSADL